MHSLHGHDTGPKQDMELSSEISREKKRLNLGWVNLGFTKATIRIKTLKKLEKVKHHLMGMLGMGMRKSISKSLASRKISLN